MPLQPIMRTFLASFALLFSIAPIAPIAWAAEGSICIAPVTKEMMGGAQAYPADGPPRKLKYELSVQVDKQAPVVVSREAGVSIAGLKLKTRHLVRVRDAGVTIESFFFTFEDRGSRDLCLWLTPFYQTWSLSPPERRPWCKCKQAPAHN